MNKLSSKQFKYLINSIMNAESIAIRRKISHFSGYHYNYRHDIKNKSRMAEQKHKSYIKRRSTDDYKIKRIISNNKYISTEKGKINFKNWYNKNHEKQLRLKRIWIRKNPSSILLSSDIQLALAFANVRKRDDNTCQWFNCNLKHRETTVHVHHIFPMSEYPELKYEEQYMICYCKEHHAQFHAARGDSYSNLIKSTTRVYEDALEETITGEKSGE